MLDLFNKHARYVRHYTALRGKMQSGPDFLAHRVHLRIFNPHIVHSVLSPCLLLTFGHSRGELIG